MSFVANSDMPVSLTMVVSGPIDTNAVLSALSTNRALTKRELFAAMAMQGILSCDRHKMPDAEFAVRDAVISADALLAELAKEPTL